MGRKYHILKAAAKDNLCSSFNVQTAVDHTGTYIIISCGKDEDFETTHPDMIIYIPESYPAEIASLAVDPLNCTKEEILAVSISEFWRGE